MTLDRRKPIDHAFIEGMRDRIEVANIIDKFQHHVDDPLKHPMTMSQLKAGEILLRKCMPDLKGVEHSGSARRELTREELIERLTALHARAATAPVNGGAGGAVVDATGPPKTH